MKKKNFELKRGSHNTKVMTDDVIAIRKMRIFRKIPRETAAQTINISAKTLERFENGRATFSDERKKTLIRRYRFTLQEYNDILESKIALPDLPARSVFNGPQKTENGPRKYKRDITKSVRIIRSMRKMKSITQPQAGKLCGYHRSVIAHLENGRINLTKNRIKHMVKSYGYIMDDFYYLEDQKILRDEVITQCQSILDKLDNEKLQAVQALLQNFR